MSSLQTDLYIQWNNNLDQAYRGVDIVIRRDLPYVKDGSLSISHKFATISFTDIDELERLGKLILVSYKQSGQLTYSHKIYQFNHEVLGEYGRIVFDFDFDGEIIDKIYRIFPKREGLIEAIEKLICDTIYDIDPRAAMVLLQKTCEWISSDIGMSRQAYPFCWTHACREKKISLHLTLPLWMRKLTGRDGMLRSLYYLINEKAKTMEKFSWILSMKNKSIMDISVADANHSLRLPWQLHSEVTTFDRVHRFVRKEHSWMNIISGIPQCFVPVDNNMHYILDIKDGDIHPYIQAILSNPRIALISVSNISLSVEDAEKLLLENDINYRQCGYTGIMSYQDSYPYSLGLRLIKGNIQDCPVCNRRHETANNTPVFTVQYMHIGLFCFQSHQFRPLKEMDTEMAAEYRLRMDNAEKDYAIELYTPISYQADTDTDADTSSKPDLGDTIDTISSDFADLYINNNNNDDIDYLFEESPQIVHTNIQEEEIIHMNTQNIIQNLNNDNILHARLLIGCSAVGTGKSELLDKIIQLYPKASILVIATRIAHANEMIEKTYRGRGFCMYNTTNRSWSHAQRLVVQMESMHKCLQQIYDIIILDECTTIFKLFLSSTLDGKLDITWNKLFHYMKGSQQVLAMDAFIGQDFVDIISYILRERERKIIINHFKPNSRQERIVYIYPSFEHLNAKLLHDRRRKFIVSTSAKQAMRLTTTMISMGISVLLQIGKDKRKQALMNGIPEDNMMYPDTDKWSLYDNVIITPAVLNGLSFVQDHFEVLYIYATRDSCDPYDIMQMSYRSRKFLTNEIHYCLHKRPYRGYIFSSLKLYNDYMDKYTSVFIGKMDKEIPSIVSIWNMASNDMKYVIGMASVRDSLGRKHMEDVMLHLFKNVMGYKVQKTIQGDTISLNNIDVSYLCSNMIAEKSSSLSISEPMKEELHIFHKYIDNRYIDYKLIDKFWRMWLRGGLVRQRLLRVINIAMLERDSRSIIEYVHYDDDKPVIYPSPTLQY